MIKNQKNLVSWALRLALSTSFLSAVADRFGLWGGNSTWGNWENFVAYTEQITCFLPQTLSPTLAALATGAEILLGIGLLIPLKTKYIANASGLLLLCFAGGMTLCTGVKAPLDYSVFSVAAAAFALGYLQE